MTTKLSDDFKHKDIIKTDPDEGQTTMSRSVRVSPHYGDRNLDGSRKWTVHTNSNDEYVFKTLADAMAFVRKEKK